MHQLGGYDFVASDPEIRGSLEFRITDHDDHVGGEHWDTERDGSLEDLQLTNGRYGEITIPDCSGTVTLQCRMKPMSFSTTAFRSRWKSGDYENCRFVYLIDGLPYGNH